MNTYPAVLVNTDDKNIRFGAMPVKADMYGLKLEGKILIREVLAGTNFRPVYYIQKTFSDMFWKLSQVKNNLYALVVGGGQNTLTATPTSIAEAFSVLDSTQKCQQVISAAQSSARPLDTNSNRIFKSTVYLKEAYLNSNTKSVILGDRVLIRDKFLIDEKTKKIIKKIYYNGIIDKDFNQSLAANKVVFTPHNNHMVAGGPLFKTSFGSLKETDVIACINTVKKILTDDLEKLKANPTLDPVILNKQKQQQQDYINNLRLNLLFKNTSSMEIDFSEYVITLLKSKEPYYKGASDKSILAKNIKYQKNINLYWPVINIIIGSASSQLPAVRVGAVTFNGGVIPMYSNPFGSPECYYPFLDNYYLVDGNISINYEQQSAPTPVYSTKSIIAGYTTK